VKRATTLVEEQRRSIERDRRRKGRGREKNEYWPRRKNLYAEPGSQKLPTLPNLHERKNKANDTVLYDRAAFFQFDTCAKLNEKKKSKTE
jgi:hypothetical protein